MTPRRLFVLIQYTPGDDVLWRAIEADQEEAKAKALQSRLRERRDHYRRQGGAA